VRNPIPILMYHQIDKPPVKGTPMRGLTVSPASFRRQMALLSALGYHGLSMRDLEPYLDGKQQGKVFGITFDDGYRNNLQHALPVLQRYRFTATCYGVSNLPGGANQWDAEIGVPQKPLMDDSDWRQWLAAGMDIGSHTCFHVDLTTMDDTAAKTEIYQSKTEFEQRLGAEIRHFCYPYGRFNERHQHMVRDAGYVTATTTRRGRVAENDDQFALRRVLVAKSTDPLRFWVKVATAYEDRRG
jgi:peptidoglycan/xylan/chitin deacetylase (PgdA/CDA1 family)